MLKQIDKLDFIISWISKEMAKEMLDFNRFPQMSEEIQRRKTTFIIREDLLKKAEELGLLGKNLSVFVEKFLEKFLEEYESFVKGLDVQARRGWDLNPRTLTGRGSRVPRSAELCNPGSLSHRG